MSVYVSRNRKHVTAAMTVVHAIVSGLTTSIGNLDKLYMDIFSSDLFVDLDMKAINCCGILRPNPEGMPSDFGRKLRLEQCDIKSRVRNDLTAVVWKDR
jgi:hypothetical protein